MKKILTIIAVLAGMTLTGCDDKLDIVPLGKSTLSTVTDLEALHYQQWLYGVEIQEQLECLCNNMYPETWITIPSQLSNPNTFNYVYLTCDEKINRQDLSDSDQFYSRFYSYINYMNVITAKAGDATGDDRLRAQIVAEARVKRAWFHFLLANIYAGQYDVATAASMGGIPYVNEIDVTVPKVKLTLSEVYDHILADCSDEVIAAMAQKSYADKTRAGADFGNGVKALVLFQMKRYDEVIPYIEKALAINSTLEDRYEAYAAGLWELDYNAPNNYMLIRGDNSNVGDYGGLLVTPEVVPLIDDKDYIKLLNGWDDNTYGYGVTGSIMCSVWEIHMNCAGIRTENMYFTAAECYIRSGNITKGLEMIDKVLEKRIYNYQPYATRTDITTEAQAMKILQDRKRVEMLTTVYNYLDRRRWNTESAYAATITHDLVENGSYTLSPTSPMWIKPFPLNCLLYNSTLTPNY